jgi:hypothetical protein
MFSLQIINHGHYYALCLVGRYFMFDLIIFTPSSNSSVKYFQAYPNISNLIFSDFPDFYLDFQYVLIYSIFLYFSLYFSLYVNCSRIRKWYCVFIAETSIWYRGSIRCRRRRTTSPTTSPATSYPTNSISQTCPRQHQCSIHAIQETLELLEL